MSRGKRNWGDDEDQQKLDLPQPPHPYQHRHVRLQVEVLAKDPPSYLVRHKNGSQWLVMTASDGTLEIAEAESAALIDITHYVLNAVRLFEAEQD